MPSLSICLQDIIYFIILIIIPTAKDYELDRATIDLKEIIGEGQFGDVHSGVYYARDGSTIPVAIKTCKVESEGTMAEKFLEEACKL